MNDKQIAIVIPVYNESQVVKNVIESLKIKRPNDIIIAVNDGSSDNSLDVLLSIKGIYTLSHDVNLGQGAALQTGIAMARKLDCKYVVTFDSDGQHSSDDIQPFFDEIESKNLDIVMGSRFLDGSTSNVSTFKKYFLKLSTIFTLIVSGVKLSDSHNGFRIINITQLSHIKPNSF
jgi:glycosyltransferase involved in cell wall biosynthesis